MDQVILSERKRLKDLSFEQSQREILHSLHSVQDDISAFC